jgi:hypothetical protein
MATLVLARALYQHRTGRRYYDKRVRLFLFVKRQSSIDDHVTRMRSLIFIGKLIAFHFHHPVKFIIPCLICSLINSMRDSKFTLTLWLLYQYLHKSASNDISRIINFADTKSPTLSSLFLESLLKHFLFPSVLSLHCFFFYPTCTLLA